MSNHAILDNITHKNLRVITDYSREFGDGIPSTLTFITEFGDVSREYPIFFRKASDSGKYQPVLIFGFESEENLFLGEQGWNASYVPAVIARGPFLIGFKDGSDNNQEVREAVVHVDLDSKRVNQDAGTPIFLEHGGNSPYLERINSILHAIHDGFTLNERMFAAFERFELIEPVAVDIELDDGTQRKMSGYSTINNDKLERLNGDALQKLHAEGFLRAAFLVVNSLNNLQRLIQMKNKQLSKR
jgi:hypothetical protein